MELVGTELVGTELLVTELLVTDRADTRCSSAAWDLCGPGRRWIASDGGGVV